MKKLIMIACMLLCLFTAICAEETGDVAFENAQVLLKDLYGNKDEIAALSPLLTTQQKYTLYKTYQKKAGLPFLAGLTVGFGTGSYLQGDWITGAAFTAVDAATVYWLFSAYTKLTDARAKVAACSADGYVANPDNAALQRYIDAKSAEEKYQTSFVYSIAALACVHIIQGVEAIVYANFYNDTLKESLGVYNSSVSVAAAPVVSLDGNVAVALCARLSF